MKLTTSKVCVTLVMIFTIGCAKDATNVLPNVYINYTESLSSPKLNKLSSAGNAVLIDGQGIAGLVIFRRRQDNIIVAYDRCSTVNPEKRCAVTIDNNNVTVTDPCSQAKFDLETGQPSKSPAQIGLKSYNTYTDQFNIYIKN